MQVARFFSKWWRTVFALDYRSLAAFRIGIGFILLADVLLRSQTLGAMYTDAGILPRPMMRQLWKSYDAVGLQQWGVGTWSLHALSGSYSWQVCLFIAAGIFAVLMSAGLFTRFATIASFVLLVSVHNRIPLVLTSGDTHLRIVMFWSIFLPLGKVWSLDAKLFRRATGPLAKSFVSPATAGLVVQVFILYFFSGLAKWNEAWWSGEGVERAIKLTIYNTEWAQSFLQYPTLLHALSYATLLTEVLFPWLLFVSYRNGWWRWLNLLTFVTMHLAITCIMTIGLFSYICSLVWLALVPGSFWARIGLSMGNAEASKTVRNSLQPRVEFAVNAFCAAMIPFMLAWNVINVDQSCIATPVWDSKNPDVVKEFRETKNPLFHAFEITGHFLGVGQHFQMFGLPPADDAWFVYRARLRNGQERDIFLKGRELKEGQPLVGRDAMPFHHWRQAHRNLTDATAHVVRQRLAEYAVEQWNKSHSEQEQVAQMRLECFLDSIWPEPIPGEAKGAVIWGSYPDGPTSPFESMLRSSVQGIQSRGY